MRRITKKELMIRSTFLIHQQYGLSFHAATFHVHPNEQSGYQQVLQKRGILRSHVETELLDKH